MEAVNLREKLNLVDEHLLLFGPRATPNTGGAGGALTSVEERI
jgi:hypothetical protein